MQDSLALPFKDGVPVLMSAMTSSRSDGSLMLGRWSEGRRGRVEVRLDLERDGKRAPAVRFDLEMN